MKVAAHGIPEAGWVQLDMNNSLLTLFITSIMINKMKTGFQNIFIVNGIPHIKHSFNSDILGSETTPTQFLPRHGLCNVYHNDLYTVRMETKILIKSVSFMKKYTFV